MIEIPDDVCKMWKKNLSERASNTTTDLVEGIGIEREVVDWGRKGPNEMITLNALRALKSARRTARG